MTERVRDSPCSLMWRICRTVSLRMAHLSGFTLKLSMSPRLAEISSASSSMYLLSCSRRLLSHLWPWTRGREWVSGEVRGFLALSTLGWPGRDRASAVARCGRYSPQAGRVAGGQLALSVFRAHGLHGVVSHRSAHRVYISAPGEDQTKERVI